LRIRLHSVGARRCAAVALCAAVATSAQAQQNARRIALKAGESTELRDFYFVVNCQSILIGTPAVEVLEGPQEVSVTYKEVMQLPRAQGCAKEVPGGSVIATAKDVDVPKESKLTVRLTYKTKVGERQSSDVYIVSLFPSRSCALQVPGAPQRLTGRVTGFVSEEQALAATRTVETQTGAQISPSYQSLQRVTVEDGSFKTMAAVPKELTVQVGDLVELNSRYRDPALACHFIPWTINRLVGHAQ
jgi:hypothetical protein